VPQKFYRLFFAPNFHSQTSMVLLCFSWFIFLCSRRYLDFKYIVCIVILRVNRCLIYFPTTNTILPWVAIVLANSRWRGTRVTLVRHTVKKAQDPLGELIMPLSCLLFKLRLFSPLLHSPGKSVQPQLLPLEATETVLLSHFPNKGSVVPFNW